MSNMEGTKKKANMIYQQSEEACPGDRASYTKTVKVIIWWIDIGEENVPFCLARLTLNPASA